jgi:peptidoglycan/xylan/chitin deacetylase (PgdA/CDA1 family)
VTLTFDDGPFPETTPEVLKLLERYKVRATFFFVGRYMDGTDVWAARTRATARRVANAGHLIGNHTHDHGLLSVGTRAHALKQIDDGARTIERVTGQRPLFFRPPYGNLDAWGERVVRRRGFELILWSAEAGDMTRTDVDAMVERIEGQLDYAGGGVVLLHDIRPTSVEVLAKLLRWLDAHRWDPYQPERKGYEVVDLITYLRATEAAPQPYATRADLEKARQDHWKATHPRAPAAARVALTEGQEPVL